MVAGFGASAGGAGAFVAAGVGELVAGAMAAAGAALQPLVQPVVMIDEPQVLQPVVQLLQGAATGAQQLGAAQLGAAQQLDLQQR